MKPEIFFEKFDLFAGAPTAVDKMRELVLDMATSGRLFPRQSEWKRQSLKSLATKIGSGATPAGGRESYFSEGIPLIRSMNVHFRGFNSTGLVFLSDQQANELSNVIVQPDDVLLNITGASIGRVTMAPAEMAGARVNQHVTIIRPTSELLPSFLWIFLAGPSVQWLINEIQIGATRQALTKGMIEQFEITLPPIEEQKRIVAKTDELLALCDQLESEQQERNARHETLAQASLTRFTEAPTPANLNFLFHSSYTVKPADLRKSILMLAVQGKLVSQDPNEQPAEVLLGQISMERDRLVKAGQIRQPENRPVVESQELFAIPSNWVWTRLGQIGDWGSGSTPPRGNHELYGGGIPWLKSGELNDNKALGGSEETVTELALKTGSFRLNKPGDVLLAMYGATIGKAAILREAAVTNQAICGCTPFSGVLNTYLFDYLRSQRDAFHSLSEGGAQPNISKVKIVTYPFPLPPLAEQRRIETKVDQLMALVDELETDIAASRITAEKLMYAIVVQLRSLE